MEEHLFPRPAVAAVLTERYVEVRLHTDTKGPEREQILALQKKYSGEDVSIPAYVIVDPATGKARGMVRGLTEEKPFLEFLKKGLEG